MSQTICDKIIVFTPIENIYLFKLNERENNIKHIPKELLGKTTAKIKFAFNHIRLVKNKKQIKPTILKYSANENYINQDSDYIQTLKVDLDRIPTDKVIDNLSNADNLKFLANNVFLDGIDFTQDFSGSYNKEEVVTWFLINRHVRMEKSYDLATHTILDNDFKISNICLTFTKHTNNGDIRYKFYYRFVQSL